MQDSVPGNIIPFNNRPITTMVVVCQLSPNILIPEAFTMLPVTQVEMPDNKCNKTLQLPHLTKGSILSMRFDKEVRGIILKPDQVSNFRNSITIDMSITDKNVNFRLSKNTIHMCGVKSFEQINETVDLLFAHFESIQQELKYLQDNPEQVVNCMKYIRLNICRKDGHLSIDDPKADYDIRIFRFLCRNIKDHNLVKNFLFELDWIITRPHIYTGSLTLQKIQTSMINKNYHIGFEIRRRILSEHIDRIDNFYHEYDNSINHSVKIMLPFEIDQMSDTIRRKKKKNDIPHHTFIVYQSGCVTQSGPSLELMEDAYYKFFKAINQLRPLIERKSSTRSEIVRINVIGNNSNNRGNSIDVSESSTDTARPQEDDINISDISQS